jgi:hypothetical protein
MPLADFFSKILGSFSISRIPFLHMLAGLKQARQELEGYGRTLREK